METIFILVIAYFIYKDMREFLYPEEWMEKVYTRTVNDVNFNRNKK